MDWPTKAVDWAIIVGAFGTLILAAFAVFGEWWKKRWNNPQLNVKVHEPGGHSTVEKKFHPLTGQVIETVKARYYSIRVLNNAKATEAKKVRVRILYLYKETPSGFKKETPPAPLSFNWAGTPENEQQPFVDIPTYDDFSIGRVWERDDKFKLKTNPSKYSFPGEVLKGDKAIIVTEVLSENALKPLRNYLRLDWREPIYEDHWDQLAPFIAQIPEREFNKLTKS